MIITIIIIILIIIISIIIIIIMIITNIISREGPLQHNHMEIRRNIIIRLW